jgi:hypothetical protein
MPAPHRFRLYVSDIAVSAFILPPLEVAIAGRPVCKNCAPLRTKMQHVMTARITLKDGFEVYDVFECLTCSTQWALTYLELKEGQS